MGFNYYYGAQADQFSFIRIPRVVLTEEKFSTLSMPAKVLYGVLLDRMALSRKNGWFDEENRVYIIYQIGEIQEDLGFSKKKAMDLLSELQDFGLLEKKRRGHGLPNILYVKSFMTGLGDEFAPEEQPMDSRDATEKTPARENNDSRYTRIGTSGTEAAVSRSPEVGTSRTEAAISGSLETGTSGEAAPISRSAGSDTQEVPKPELLEVPEPAPLMSYTDKNYTYRNYKSNLISSTEEEDEIRSDVNRDSGAYESLILENIGYDDLQTAHPAEKNLIDGIAALILETVLSSSETIVIASNRYPASVVKSRFLKLSYSHIEYVLYCFRKNTTKVANIRKYLLAALFNAPSTMEGFYQAEVSHDMAKAAGV